MKKAFFNKYFLFNNYFLLPQVYHLKHIQLANRSTEPLDKLRAVNLPNSLTSMPD